MSAIGVLFLRLLAMSTIILLALHSTIFHFIILFHFISLYFTLFRYLLPSEYGILNVLTSYPRSSDEQMVMHVLERLSTSKGNPSIKYRSHGKLILQGSVFHFQIILSKI